MMFSPLVTDGLSHPYHLGEPTSISIGASEVIFQLYFILFSMKFVLANRVAPDGRPRFAYVP